MTFQKRLGVARYSARFVNRSNLIELTAAGILPCSNYSAQLEQRPEDVSPPNWNMVFYTEPSCEKALQAFEVTVSMIGTPGETEIVRVRDALGWQEVPVAPGSAAAPESAPAFAEAGIMPPADEYLVYSDIVPPGHKPTGCFIVPEGTLVVAIYAWRYGPAPRSECEAWIDANCAASVARGGEVPWPLLRDAD